MASDSPKAQHNGLPPFRVILLSLIENIRILLPAVRACSGSIDQINELARLRNKEQEALNNERVERDRLQVIPENQAEIARRQEGVDCRQKQIDSYNHEIEELCKPFPPAERQRRVLVEELRTLLKSLPMKPAVLREIRAEIERLELLTDPHVGMRKTSEELAILEQRLVEIHQPLERNERIQATFPTPAGAKWEDVAIRFLSDHRLEVNVLGERAAFNYVEAGFEDRRSKKPNLAWVFLNRLAQRSGRVDRPVALEEIKKSEKNIQALRKHLKKLFELNDDPFRPFREVKRYQTRFKVSFPQAEKL